ncbi:MFS transporter [Microbispora corallina]|nr:MFS transporter [Microbispora corallina]
MADATGSTTATAGRDRRAGRFDRDHPRYRWVALSNTTLGMLLATVNSSIVIISLPAIFRGIGLDPLRPANVGYLLWMIMGFLLVSAVLVVPAGRLGDMFGRVRIYNSGFVIFTAGSIGLSLDPLSGGPGALWLIGWRVVQGVGGAMLFANSTAILTDAFPLRQRGTALGVNQVAAIAGSFLGLLIGGLLSEWHWRAVFLVSVPIGLAGTVWSYASLNELGERRRGRLDWPGNVTFALGLGVLLAAITYGIQPYGGHATGWTNPWVLAGLTGGVALLAAFCVIEARVAEPMFHLTLFRIPQFSAGSLAVLLSAMGRGGLQFMLIIWLQGIWLPLHGFAFEDTPLWAGIYMLPLTVGFLAAGPVSGYLSDRYGQRLFASGGLLITAATFLGLLALPVDFPYWAFALLLAVNGVGSGVFSSPNTSRVMSSVPAHQRGAAAGMRGTFQNSGQALSIGIFFSLLIVGLATSLPGVLTSSLERAGVPAAAAQAVGHLPPVGSVFAAFLGYNPVRTLLPPDVLHALPPAAQDRLTGNAFFPTMISGPVHQGLVVVFSAAAVMMIVGAAASMFDGRRSRAGAGTPAAGDAPVVPH